MGTTSSAGEQAPRGYLSEESKRKYAMAVGILGVIFLFTRFVLPLVEVNRTFLIRVLRGTMFSGGAAYLWDFLCDLLMWLLPAMFALVIAALMRRHRVCEFDTGTARVPFAPLSRRAVSQVIDGLILAGPPLAAFYLLMSGAFSPGRLLTMVGHMGVFAGGFVWAILWLLIFSVLEGKWGQTPGKWITRIKVLGTDLKPCGLGRALLRNVLKCVDGSLNFMVGVMVAALTEHWQRVGDLVARTIVVRVERPRLGDTPQG